MALAGFERRKQHAAEVIARRRRHVEELRKEIEENKKAIERRRSGLGTPLFPITIPNIKHPVRTALELSLETAIEKAERDRQLEQIEQLERGNAFMEQEIKDFEQEIREAEAKWKEAEEGARYARSMMAQLGCDQHPR